MKVKLFVDLDDTLIDTASLKEEMFGVVVDHRVPREEVEGVYRDIREKGGFSLKNFCNAFASYGLDPAALQNSLNAVFDRADDHLLEDRLAWLGERFPEEKYEWILLTIGDSDIQERKISALKLRSIFDRVIIVPENKLSTLRGLVEPEESFIIVDDRGKILDEIDREFPNAEAYQARVKGEDPELYISEDDMHREGRVR